MELKLNIYEGKKITKTYTATDFTLMTGTCEDIVEMVDIDKLTGGKLEDKELGMEVVKIVAKSFKKFKPFMQDVFDGLTDEEYRHTSIKEVGRNVVQIVKYTIGELMNVGNEKN